MSYSRVRIAARLRPAIPGEQHDKAIRLVRTDAGSAICVDNPRDPSQTFKYPFSSCYDEFSTQEEIFERDVQPLIELAFSGITVTVFAYGVTSSGKTHTMQGNKDQPGIIPRAVEDIFTRTASLRYQSSIQVSYMEIYKDEVYDLLVDRDTAAKLPVRENEFGQVFVANLSIVPVNTLQDFDKLFTSANKQRSVSSTNLNSVSSRSHAILTLHVSVVDPVHNMTLSGKLNLVDLAGSENNKHTGNDAARMAESAAINKSLSVLGQVVHALNSGASRIPYRNSKLTRILQDALGGSSEGLLICNLAPGTKFRQDTLNTLNFAVRSKNIQNKPVVNQQATIPVPGPSRSTIPHPAPSGRQSLLPNAIPGPSRLPGPRPSRAPRPSAVEVVDARSLLPPATMVKHQPPPLPVHLTEDEINMRIAKAVELEVARRLEEERARERQRREEEEAAAEASRSASMQEESRSQDSSLQSLPSGLLTPLLKSSRDSHDDELKRRLDELEARFERANKTAVHLADALSPVSRKKTGRAYVALARSQSNKNNLEVALDLYRKAESYVPDNVKLKDRIIELEWAVRNNRPFKTSPKKPRRSGSQSKRERTKNGGRRKHKANSECDAVPEEGEDDASAKENAEVHRSPAKRRMKSEDAETATPPKKRRVAKAEE